MAVHLSDDNGTEVRAVLEGTRLRFGKLCTNLSVFSLQIVWITSSGGVPRSCVMIEN